MGIMDKIFGAIAPDQTLEPFGKDVPKTLKGNDLTVANYLAAECPAILSAWEIKEGSGVTISAQDIALLIMPKLESMNLCKNVIKSGSLAWVWNQR